VPDAGSRRRAATTCGWCKAPLKVKARGRIPKWCSATCRQRAWEQSRAAASGRSAIKVVERHVEVPTLVPLTRNTWSGVLRELARQLDDGRIYDRDLHDLATALGTVLDAYRRRAEFGMRTPKGQR
jgi:hypothetical protein